MYSYYRKVLLWTMMNVASSMVIVYVVTDADTRMMSLIGMTQAAVTLSIYSPFEYYWTWTPESPCLTN